MRLCTLSVHIGALRNSVRQTVKTFSKKSVVSGAGKMSTAFMQKLVFLSTKMKS